MKRTCRAGSLAVVLLLVYSKVGLAQSTFVVDQLTDIGEGSGMSGDLRYCITQAQDGDTITFQVVGTINLTGALPDLTRSISIAGPGADVLTVRRDVGGDYRIFTVSSSATVLIFGLSISNGRSESGGGVANSGTLTVDSCTVSSNSLTGAGVYGGGIFNQGILMLMNSTIAGNQAGGDGFGDGGGIYNGGQATISNSTVAHNSAWGLGGHGGGIYTGGTLSISHSTVVANEAVGEIAGFGGGIVTGGVFHSWNTIIALNRTSDHCNDVYGPLGSLGHNLIGDNGGGSCTDPDPTDLVNVNPLLGPLQDNGGPTPTFALLPGSPAIDAGDNDSALEFDQRGPGFPRIVNGIIDIGAFEVQ